MIRAAIASILTVVTLAGCQVTVNPPPNRPPPNRPPEDRPPARAACVMYQHADYRGRAYRLGPNARVGYVGNGFNDQMSSARVARGCRLTVHEHARFRGARRSYGDDVSFVGRRWNDRVSAASCTCR